MPPQVPDLGSNLLLDCIVPMLSKREINPVVHFPLFETFRDQEIVDVNLFQWSHANHRDTPFFPSHQIWFWVHLFIYTKKRAEALNLTFNCNK